MHRPPRSSLAIALDDYKGPRPGIALTIAAVALLIGIAVGVMHVFALGRAGDVIEDSSQAVRTLHSYNAALEVWRQMAADTVELSPMEATLKDSIALSLRRELSDLQAAFDDPVDRELVGDILSDFTPSTEGGTGEVGLRGREAMIVLTARQDSALFHAAADYEKSQYMAALFIGLAVIAAGVMIIPMSWVYVRYKRGIPPGM